MGHCSISLNGVCQDPKPYKPSGLSEADPQQVAVETAKQRKEVAYAEKMNAERARLAASSTPATPTADAPKKGGNLIGDFTSQVAEAAHDLTSGLSTGNIQLGGALGDAIRNRDAAAGGINTLGTLKERKGS